MVTNCLVTGKLVYSHHEIIKKTDVDAVIVGSWRTEFFNSGEPGVRGCCIERMLADRNQGDHGTLGSRM